MRPIAIGESDFQYMIERQCLYVDKSLFIKDLIDDPSRVILITRPRRFGKTLNLSMLKYFFAKSDQNMAYLFKDLQIWKENEKYKKIQGQYIVIFFTPIQQGYFTKFYTEIVDFMRLFLGAVLKDNIYLEKAVLTGIVRVSKERFFSGLNNVHVCSILSVDYAQYFGLLEHEVNELLIEYHLEHEKQKIQQWYNGYQFGNLTGIYNPWSICNFLKTKQFQPFWLNTSSNELIRDLLTTSPIKIKIDLENLIEDHGIIGPVDEMVNFFDLMNNPNSIWSLFLASGYLILKPQESGPPLLFIPNDEVRKGYEIIIQNWFNSLSQSPFPELIELLIKGEIDSFSVGFQKIILETFSTFDVGNSTAENFYHAFILGMFIHLKSRYIINSNRESGLGRYDICLIPIEITKPGIIIEFKLFNPKTDKSLEQTAEKAMKQIEIQKYDTILYEKRINIIYKIAIVFEGKKVLIKVKKGLKG